MGAIAWGRLKNSISVIVKDGTTLRFRMTTMTPNAPGSRAPWMTAEEGAAYLEVGPRTLLGWARQGKVKGYKLSGTQRHVWRFLIEDLDATMVAPSVALQNRRIL